MRLLSDLLKECVKSSGFARGVLDYFNLGHMYSDLEPIDPSEADWLLQCHNEVELAPQNVNPIAKLIHFVWLGSGLPQNYMQNMRTWFAHNPDYKFNLWIDSATLPLEVSLIIVQDIQEFCSRHNVALHDISLMPEFKEFTAQSFYNDWVNGSDRVLAFAADSLRLLILYLYGGIYSDIDTTCRQSLGTLSNNTGLFVWGATDDKSGPSFIDNCMIASVPHNPILLKSLEQMKINYKNFMICTKDDKGSIKDDKEWTTLVYNRRRFNDCENDCIRSINFGAIAFLKIASEEIEKIYGKQGVKDGVIEHDTSITHEAKKSWQASASIIKRKRKGVQTTHVPNADRLTAEVAKLRGRLGV